MQQLLERWSSEVRRANPGWTDDQVWAYMNAAIGARDYPPYIQAELAKAVGNG